jgi:hypothetical protein
MPKFITVNQDANKYHINIDNIYYINKSQFIFGSVKYNTEIKMNDSLICCQETVSEIMEMINA